MEVEFFMWLAKEFNFLANNLAKQGTNQALLLIKRERDLLDFSIIDHPSA